MVVESRPVSPEREDEYNRWYDETHIPEISAIAGFVGARRYRMIGDGGRARERAVHDYIVLYELEADDVTRPVQELRERSAAGLTTKTDAISTDPPPAVRLYRLVE